MKDIGNPQRYVPEWESIAKAVQRVAANGLGEDEVKADLCHAIAKRKIRVLVTLSKDDRVYPGENVRIPPRLKPTEIDWINSRPTAKWLIGPTAGQHYAWLGDDLEQIALLEVLVEDISAIFCLKKPVPSQQLEPSQQIKEETEWVRPHRRRRGATPSKSLRIEAEMRRMDRNELENMIGKQMMDRFKAAISTCTACRDRVLSENVDK